MKIVCLPQIRIVGAQSNTSAHPKNAGAAYVRAGAGIAGPQEIWKKEPDLFLGREPCEVILCQCMTNCQNLM